MSLRLGEVCTKSLRLGGRGGNVDGGGALRKVSEGWGRLRQVSEVFLRGGVPISNALALPLKY